MNCIQSITVSEADAPSPRREIILAAMVKRRKKADRWLQEHAKYPKHPEYTIPFTDGEQIAFTYPECPRDVEMWEREDGDGVKNNLVIEVKA